MRPVWAIAAMLVLAGCAPAPRVAAPQRPMRIVSLDYCADQYVLKLVERDRILAVSPDADRSFSYMRAAAAGMPSVVPRAEDVLVLKPDLVVRSYGGGPDAAAFFARAGVPVLQLAYADTIAAIRAEVPGIAAGLGAGARGAALIRTIDGRLAALPRGGGTRTALYTTPGGVTAGPGTLIDDMLARSGNRNFQRAPGWHPLPLEALAYALPDRVAAARFASHADVRDRWSSARHPIVRDLAATRPVVAIDGAATACGGWFVLDAVEAMAGVTPR